MIAAECMQIARPAAAGDGLAGVVAGPLSTREGALLLQGPVITSVELERMLVAGDLIAGARDKAAALLRLARRRAAAAREAGLRAAALTQEQARRELADELAQARAAAVAETVTWLVQEQDLERQVAAQLEARIKGLITQALTDLYGQQDLAPLLMRRVSDQLAGLEGGGTLIVRVHQDRLAALSQALGSRAAVQADAALTVNQAVLDSPLVQIQIDLDRQLHLLVERLGRAA